VNQALRSAIFFSLSFLFNYIPFPLPLLKNTFAKKKGKMGKSHTTDVGTATYVHTFVINAVMVQGRLRARPLSHGQCISAKYNVFPFFLPAHINLCRSSFRYFSDTLCTIIFNQAS